MFNPVWQHVNWLFRKDDGTLSTATDFVVGGENTAITADDNYVNGTKFRLRVDFGDDNAADSNNTGISVKLQYSLNSGTWTDVPTTAGDDGIAMASSDQSITDGDGDTTQRLSGITGSTFNSAYSEYDENNSTATHTWQDDFGEFEFCMVVNGNPDDVYEFRPATNGGAVDSNPPTLASLTLASLVKEPGVVDPGLDLTGKIPTLKWDYAVSPAVVDPGLDLTGKVPTFKWDYVVSPAKAFLTLFSVRGLTLAGQDVVAITTSSNNHTREPGVVDPGLDLNGKQATLAWTINPDVVDPGLDLTGKAPTLNSTLTPGVRSNR
jgi:hypothetical protein